MEPIIFGGTGLGDVVNDLKFITEQNHIARMQRNDTAKSSRDKAHKSCKMRLARQRYTISFSKDNEAARRRLPRIHGASIRRIINTLRKPTPACASITLPNDASKRSRGKAREA